MKLTTICPNCSAEITSKQWEDQDWFFCSSCQSLFFSHESLRENWPSLYHSLKEKEEESPKSTYNRV
jgi:Zn-finger nucleic acid-binding protein